MRRVKVENKNVLTEGCAYFGITLSQEQISQFQTYYELLVEWNRFMNLTAITEFEEVMLKHFVDSLALGKALSVEKISRMIDVGTGAGFPGIPLKIVYPQLDVVLMDSLNKRVNFLKEVIEKLGLSGITAVHGRAEDLARKPEYREQFDLSVSRAVANLASLSEYCLPFTKVGGYFIPYKSGQIEEELEAGKKAVSVLGGSVKEVVKFQLPNSEMDRSLIVIQKVRETGKKYPRKAGLPGKEPIR
jgi:16S rRNA (guanine527-N7)-methyltransferase